MSESHKGLKPDSSLLLWLSISIVILVSLMAITLVPYILYPSISYNPDLALAWIAITGGLISAGVAIERFREATRSRKSINSPKIILSNVDFTFFPERIAEVKYSAHSKILLTLSNYGKGHAFNLKLFLYALDKDNIEWLPISEYQKDHIQFLEKFEFRTTSYDLERLRGEEYNLVVEIQYENIFNEIRNNILYLLVNEDEFDLIEPSKPEPFDTGYKFQTVKKYIDQKKKDHPEIISFDLVQYDTTQAHLNTNVNGNTSGYRFSLLNSYEQEFKEKIIYWPSYAHSRFEILKPRLLSYAEELGIDIKVELNHEETGFLVWHFKEGKKRILLVGNFSEDDDHHIFTMKKILSNHIDDAKTDNDNHSLKDS